MRHASSCSTLEIYSQARTADKRAAQQKTVVQMIFPEALNRDHSIGDHSEHSHIDFVGPSSIVVSRS